MMFVYKKETEGLFDSIVSVEATFAKGKGVDAIRKGARLDGLSGALSDELTGLEPPNNARRRFILRDAKFGSDRGAE